MSTRERIIAGAVAALVHVLAFAPTIGAYSSPVEAAFFPDAAAIEKGALPYAERDFEYPPLALPLIMIPAWVSDDLDGYEAVFELEMLVFDLAIVALLAFALRASRRRVWAALGVYTAGVIAVSGIILPDSAIEDAPLALARFDLAVAALVLAAVLARMASRSATWAAALSAGIAVKAFPAALYPPLLQGERNWRRVAIATALALAAGIAVVAAFGDQFWSAIAYHSGRDLQIETLGATPIMLAHLLFDSGAQVNYGSGSWNLDASGADALRVASIVVVLAGVGLALWRAWVVRPPLLVTATAVIAIGVVFAPVLSPQFLLWVLPISAAAWGLRAPNLVLLACFVLTQIELHFYGGIGELAPRFVLPLAARNALLLVYLALVLAPLMRPVGGGEPATASA